jgi:hypothetical protein
MRGQHRLVRPCCVLAAPVAVVHQLAPLRPPCRDGHLQRLQRERDAHMVGHRPADDPAGVRVQHGGKVQPPLGGPQGRQVGDPQLVPVSDAELPLDDVRRRGRLRITHRRTHPPAPATAPQPRGLHQPRHPLAAHAVAPVTQLRVPPRHAVGLPALGMNATDCLRERLICLRPLG